jgi:hypothetical protein
MVVVILLEVEIKTTETMGWLIYPSTFITTAAAATTTITIEISLEGRVKKNQQQQQQVALHGAGTT